MLEKKIKPNPIRSLRLAADLTQEVAAGRAGIRQGAWSELESRDSIDGATLATLRRVARGLGVGIELLTRGD